MLVQQMYEQRKLVGKISSVVGFMNMEHLMSELLERGWIAKLKDDQETIYLISRGEQKKIDELEEMRFHHTEGE